MSTSLLSRSSSKKPSTAKRNLFGSSDYSSDEFCSRLLEEIIAEKCHQWGFDFNNGIPFASSSDFEYNQVPSSSIPGFYRCTSLAGSSGSHLKRQPSDTSISSDSENYDPSSSMIDMDSSMEFDDNKLQLRIPQKPKSTPRKIRVPIIQRKRITGNKKGASPKSLASSNDGKITSHMNLRVSKRIVKKTTTSSNGQSKTSSSGAFIFNQSATTGSSD
jgi:hypothetical protein